MFIDHFGLSPAQFGLIFGLCAAWLIAASQVNPYALSRWGSSRVLRTAVRVSLLATAALTCVAWIEAGVVLAVLIPLFVNMASFGFIQPNATVGALARHPAHAGSASALLGTLQFMLGATSGLLVGLLSDGSVRPMAALHAGGRGRRQHCRPQPAADIVAALIGKGHAAWICNSPASACSSRAAPRGSAGRAAEILADEGCDVVLVARDPATLEEAASAIRGRRQVSVRVIAADLSSDDAVRRVAAEAGEIDILVNNAGAIPGGNLVTVDDATWRRAWDLKVFGYHLPVPGGLSRHGGAPVRGDRERDRRGRRVVRPELHRWQRGERRADGVHPRARQSGAGRQSSGGRHQSRPGRHGAARDAELRTRAGQQFGDPERWRELFAGMPFGRAATPAEIGYAVAFLASPLSGYTSGTILTIDGGRS